MILIQLEVPSLGTCYNVSINEHQKAGVLLEELLDLVRKKSGEAGTDTERYDLFSVPGGERLKKNLPAGLQGIKDGARLVLV